MGRTKGVESSRFVGLVHTSCTYQYPNHIPFGPESPEWQSVETKKSRKSTSAKKHKKSIFANHNFWSISATRKDLESQIKSSTLDESPMLSYRYWPKTRSFLGDPGSQFQTAILGGSSKILKPSQFFEDMDLSRMKRTWDLYFWGIL